MTGMTDGSEAAERGAEADAEAGHEAGAVDAAEGAAGGRVGPYEGGEPACLLHLVCPDCGRLTTEPGAAVCSRCGAPLDD